LSHCRGEQLVAASGDGFANERLGSAVSVHFCDVDQRHAEIEADVERRNFVLSMPRVFGHAPCPLAKRGYRLARGQPCGRDAVRCGRSDRHGSCARYLSEFQYAMAYFASQRNFCPGAK
jgi:hypothetical protein